MPGSKLSIHSFSFSHGTVLSPKIKALSRCGLCPAPKSSCLSQTAAAPKRWQRAAASIKASSQPQSDLTATVVNTPQRVFVFDAYNDVQEVMVQPHADLEAAEEILLHEEANNQGPPHDNGDGVGREGGVPSRRTPLPLRSMTPLQSRSGAGARAVSPLAARFLQSMTQMGGGQAVGEAAPPEASLVHQPAPLTSIAKSSEMQRQLVAQLEREQSQVAHLQQYESMYREWRMKSQRLEADLNSLQRMVAEKDAELAHGYKLLEASAIERSRLRHAFQAVQEKTKLLQASLEKQGAGLLGSPLSTPLLNSGRAGSPGETDSASGKGDSREGESVESQNGVKGGSTPPPPANPQVHAAIEELTMMAKGMAQEMSIEIRALHRLAKSAPNEL